MEWEQEAWRKVERINKLNRVELNKLRTSFGFSRIGGEAIRQIE